ncbi:MULTISPECIES: sulfurtransferase [Dietzia]|uniref:Sulfurtransferase n=1 Tax=Dietzia cinnamea TaxID=321318 RepID=A0A4R3ZR81_9ACTN|nr:MULTISPECIES: sulfurtransferase [Dietzia]MCT1885888.1 sulfurtransferase [Dietzia cinnamea]MCT2059245.1 sulfurtransferase [Dietzia cinnamea]MCT2175113.1 sulfurtransferase [Dietzia cinnamea]TCW22071.1 thiosulfate sulfurtransferase [Dietzia cinnamea]
MSRDDVLVSTSWASSRLADDSVVFLEVDEDVTAYHTDGHIPGAVALDWRTELQQQYTRDLVDRERFGELMSERGISRDHTIVVYGGNHNWFAAYAYWYLRLYGHRDVRLLDGGRMLWEREGRPLETEAPRRPVTDYVADPQDLSIRAFRDDVLAGLGRDGFVDVRSVDEYTGRLAAPAGLPQEGGRQRGHIPGAVSIPWNRAVTRDGTFRSDAELREIYSDVLDDPARRIVAYCRIGERSSHTWFVLHELLDQPNVVNYDGSWVEYGSLIGVPVER